MKQCLCEKCWKGYVKRGMKTLFGKKYPNCVKKSKAGKRRESVKEAERKMSSLEMQQIILLAKAMKQMPGSPAQKKIKQQINVIRKKLGQKPVKESLLEKMGPKELHAYMQHVFDTQFKTADDKKMKKTLIKKINIAQKKKGLPLFKESVNEISSYGEYVEDNARMLAQDYRRQDKKLAKALDHVADRINQSYPGRNRITKNDVKDIIKQPYDRKLMRPMMRFNLDDLFESVNEVSGVDVAKKVLKNKQMEKGLDLQTANLIVTIDKAYDKKPALQKKFRAIKLPKMKQLILKFGR